jgi:DNA-binding transcriptional LysR family regulator
MDLNLIHLFLEIVESRSMSAAARKLDITRTNISQRFKLLERETGTQLLRRSTRSFKLTQAGHSLYECGQRLRGGPQRDRASIESLGRSLSGRVRISVPIGFGRMFIGSKLLAFAHTHEGITLNVTFDIWRSMARSNALRISQRIRWSPRRIRGPRCSRPTFRFSRKRFATVWVSGFCRPMSRMRPRVAVCCASCRNTVWQALRTCSTS